MPDVFDSTQERRSISLLNESLAYFGAVLVLLGGGVAVAEEWQGITAWQRAGIFAGAAVFFLAAGLAVTRITDPVIQRMISVVWFVSAACAGVAAGLAAGGALGSSGAVAVLAAGLAIAITSGILWLANRRELQMVGMFAGVTLALCTMFIAIAGSAGPWLATALGLWALGVGWVIVGWQYPQPLWSTVPLATAIALIAPAIAVWQHGWVFAIGIGTAAAAMEAGVSRRQTALLTAGTLTLFGYLTAVAVRYFHASPGLPATLAGCGVLLLTFALVLAWIRRAGRSPKPQPVAPDAGLRVAETPAAGDEDASAEMAGPGHAGAGHAGLERAVEPPIVELQKAS